MYLCVPEGSIWRLPSDQLGGSECSLCFTSQVDKAFLQAIFLPQWGTGSMFLSGGGACPLSCCIGPNMDHVAVWCGLTPPTIGDYFSSLVHQYFTRSFKESIVLRLGLTCIRVFWGVFTLILNRLPLCSKSTAFPLQPLGCLNPTKSCEPRLAR